MVIEKSKLDYYFRLVNETILSLQDIVTGLVPASPVNPHAWIRDNVYMSLSIWGLSMAYKKVPDVDEDRSRGYELEKSVLNLMRGILRCYMYQSDKVEAFKKTQNPSHSLHAKFDSKTCKAVVGDYEWGHLQIDAVSLYLLALAQMTASGLRIIWTVDEVAFIQNLVFYIEPASRIPDYGIWERGDKTNHGLPELNASSVGLAKAALESLNGLDLFGPQGGHHSTIHALIDECQQCNTVLENMLPRESYSKETDAALLAVISFPAFAVTDENIIEKTRSTVLNKLLGSYGCTRFLRDGYRTARENPNRLHYEPWELRMFDGIECEWPLFFPYLILDACFNGNTQSANDYLNQLEQVVLHRKMSILGKETVPQLSHLVKPKSEADEVLYPIMPELYSLPANCIDAELATPHSQVRVPIGSAPHLWGQSLYILSRMIMDGLLLPGEVDPLCRRMAAEPKPDLVVQVVVLSEDETVKERLASYQLESKTFAEARRDSGIHIYPAKMLTLIYKQLGVCPKLGLTGRTAKDIGVLSTSSLYRVGNTTMAFTPQQEWNICERDHKIDILGGKSRITYWDYFIDSHAFYVNLDVDFILDSFKANVAFLRRSWSFPGRPTLLLPVAETFVVENRSGLLPSIVNVLKKLKSGYINGTRVVLGQLKQFEATSCVQKLSFLKSTESIQKRHSVMRTGSARRRRLTLTPNQYRPTVEFGSPAFADHSNFGSFASTPSSTNPLSACSPISIHLPSHFYGGSGDHDQNEGVQRTSLRRKSLALACAVSVDLAMDDEEGQDFSLDDRGTTSGWRDSEYSSLDHGPNEDEQLQPRLRTGDKPDTGEEMDEVAFRRMLIHHPDGSRSLDQPESHMFTRSRPTLDFPIDTPTDNLVNESGVGNNRRDRASFDSQTSSGGSDERGSAADWLTTLSVDQLVEHLKLTDNMFVQAEILGKLKQMQGLDWDTGIDPDNMATVRSLLKEVYQRACLSQNWLMLRYLAGLLDKIADQLANAVSSILILQKQITIGLPPKPREKVIIAPLPSAEIAKLIQEACGEDSLMAMLTQEILLHLSMFARSRPYLLANVLRLRTGLIIQLMVAELARSMQSSVDVALFDLFSMSPFETNQLLTNLLSGKEIRVVKVAHAHSTMVSSYDIKLATVPTRRKSSVFLKVTSPSEQSNITSPSLSMQHSPSGTLRPNSTRFSSTTVDPMQALLSEPPTEARNLWSRRRKIDGSLNRVPPEFFERTYCILERLQGLRIGEHTLTTTLTKEMTKEEFKFALAVESFINTVSTPEYRQLLVEATTVLGALVMHDEEAHLQLNCIVSLDDLVTNANHLFLEDQSKHEANATLCCARNIEKPSSDDVPNGTPTESNPTGMFPRFMKSVGAPLECRGSHRICQHFYDTPPAGRFGTMAYMVRALAYLIGDSLPVSNRGEIAVNCAVA